MLCPTCQGLVPPSRGRKPRKYCSTRCSAIARGKVLGQPLEVRSCEECSAPYQPKTRQAKYCKRACLLTAIKKRKRADYNGRPTDEDRARWRRKNYSRRTARRVVDVTTEYENQLRSKAKRCPICRTRLTDTPFVASSKELDHIVPINIGGTHTIGNVRIICRQCNQRRPDDGSDFTGQPTLWAQDREVADALTPNKPKRIWRCKICKAETDPGYVRCPSCKPSERGRRAADLRAAGWKWREIADQLGYANEAGAWLAAAQAMRDRSDSLCAGRR